MRCSRHCFLDYMNDEKTHAAINKEVFNRLGHINKNLCQRELWSQTETKKANNSYHV